MSLIVLSCNVILDADDALLCHVKEDCDKMQATMCALQEWEEQ